MRCLVFRRPTLPFTTTAVRVHPTFMLTSAVLTRSTAGTVQLKLSDWTAAAHDFESAIAISAEVAAHHYAFAVALERIGRREEA